MKSFEFTLLKKCAHCGLDLPVGFARCRDRDCRRLRPEFDPHPAVVKDHHGHCAWKGALTDVRLPDGMYLWAPYFLDAVRAGWLDGTHRWTDKYREARRVRAERKGRG